MEYDLEDFKERADPFRRACKARKASDAPSGASRRPKQNRKPHSVGCKKQRLSSRNRSLGEWWTTETTKDSLNHAANCVRARGNRAAVDTLAPKPRAVRRSGRAGTEDSRFGELHCSTTTLVGSAFRVCNFEGQLVVEGLILRSVKLVKFAGSPQASTFSRTRVFVCEGASGSVCGARSAWWCNLE